MPQSRPAGPAAKSPSPGGRTRRGRSLKYGGAHERERNTAVAENVAENKYLCWFTVGKLRLWHRCLERAGLVDECGGADPCPGVPSAMNPLLRYKPLLKLHRGTAMYPLVRERPLSAAAATPPRRTEPAPLRGRASGTSSSPQPQQLGHDGHDGRHDGERRHDEFLRHRSTLTMSGLWSDIPFPKPPRSPEGAPRVSRVLALR
jgi:hypothetical protein